MPQVSVIIPSYNHQAYIGEAIESILAQTYTDIELIVVDDASTDNSTEVIRTIQQQDSRIRAVFHDRNLGSAKTFNHGCELAQGDFICILTSDDAYPPERIAHQVALATHPDNRGKVIVGDWVDVDQQGQLLPNPFSGSQLGAQVLKRHGDIFENLIEVWKTYISFQTLFLSRDHLTHVQFDERFPLVGHEFKFALDLASRYRFHKMDEIVFLHRIHGQNLSCSKQWFHGQLSKEMNEIACDTLDRHAHRLPPHLVVGLQERIVKHALHERNFTPVKKYLLEHLGGHPQFLEPLQQALVNQSETDVHYPFVFQGDKPYSLAEVGITKSEIAKLRPVKI